jgi:ribosomal protein S18 acetylase RimI-like enzyme
MAAQREIRPFGRADRDQLTGLVNAHVAAVVPGGSISVNRLMSQLEREPEEGIVDPWVVERMTLVAVERDAVVGGAHLLRYGDDERVGESYRGAAEIRWLVHGHRDDDAGDALIQACFDVMDGWGADPQWADGALPAPFVYGVPNVWPHIRALYERNGLIRTGKVEIVFVARVDDLPRLPAGGELDVRRSVGMWTRFTASRDEETVGFLEVDTHYGDGGRLPVFARWADVGNLCVAEGKRRRGIATLLLAHGAEWLRLGGLDRLVAYAWPEQTDQIGFYEAVGFRELVRTERGWTRQRA